MKIRTDFVTNSSSSSFVLEIYIELENGKTLLFEANGGTDEVGMIDYFYDEAIVTVSPKQLGSAKSVQELIELLKNGVYDGWPEYRNKLFENKTMHGVKRKKNPTHFISMIEDYVTSMDDIRQIVILGNEEGFGLVDNLRYYRTFSYSPKTKEYVRVVQGEEFEKNGCAGGDLLFDDAEEASDVNNIHYALYWDAINPNEYVIMKRKEEKQKLREAVVSGKVEAILGNPGVAGVLATQLAREISQAPESITFSGKNFVHTSCSNEEMIDKFILSRGGEVRSSTVQATDYIIIGNKIDRKTTKITRAAELNSKGKSIIAMTESEFWNLAATC